MCVCFRISDKRNSKGMEKGGQQIQKIYNKNEIRYNNKRKAATERLMKIKV